jgi:solute carrier family 30 (zinc transporter), member 5/7
MQEKKDALFSYQFPDGDRRLAFSRQPSFRQWDPHLPSPSPSTNPLMHRSHSFRPYLARSDSNATMPFLEKPGKKDATWIALMLGAVRGVANGSRPMKRLALMISLNVAYSMIELLIGLFTGRVG